MWIQLRPILIHVDLDLRHGFSFGGFARLLGGGDRWLQRVWLRVGNLAAAGILLRRIQRGFAKLLGGVDCGFGVSGIRPLPGFYFDGFGGDSLGF